MALKGPKPVYTGRDKPDAQLAKIFLLKNGIHAIVKGERSEMVRSLLGHALGLLRRMRSPVLGGPFGLDLEVLVEREDAGQAAALIAEYEKRNRSATDEEESYDPADFIRVVCDGCKRPAFFHVSKRGRVEQCPHCADYVDVR